MKLNEVKRQVKQIRQSLDVAQIGTNTLAVLIIGFDAYSDGTVPDCTDRELPDWEIMQGHPSVVVVSALHEWALREGHTKQRCYMNITVDDDLNVQTLPEAPKEKRIPLEQFFEWLETQDEQLKTKRDERFSGTK